MGEEKPLIAQGGIMQHDTIISYLKMYQSSKKKPLTKKPWTQDGVRNVFLHGINRRVLRRHGEMARCALCKVLEAMFVVPLHPLLCLDAMLQLCRDDASLFTELEDAKLIRHINTNVYFSGLTCEEMSVETQEGVV